MNLLLFLFSLILASVSMGKEFDSYKRFVDLSQKKEMPCPKTAPRVARLLIIGQSNSANHGEELIKTKFPGQVSNYFDGKCYVASSPLLGASGKKGDFGTLLGDELIASGKFDSVVIVSSGISSSSVSLWKKGGELNRMLSDVVTKLPFPVDFVIWHQGEDDYEMKTPGVNYARDFKSLHATLQEKGIKAPLFMSIATKCGRSWAKENEVARAQMGLVDHKDIFLGINTDELLSPEDRTKDQCHLSGRGQAKVAKALAGSIISCLDRSKK